MVKLLIIADDFTGALDTAVQFVLQGVATQVITDSGYDFSKTENNISVLVIDSETRHMDPEDAYRTVKQIVECAVRAGISMFYKKTDSALRGNIGSELQAIMDGSNMDRLDFAPAFPIMNRVTMNGIQYIDDVPVADSVFGKDIYAPVRHSEVAAILAEQTVLPLYNHGIGEPVRKGSGIHIHDALTEINFRDIFEQLEQSKELKLLAGCAGFASILPEMLGIKGNFVSECQLEPAILVICGSINPITQVQLEDAEKNGFLRFYLSPKQKLDGEWIRGEECEKQITDWTRMLKENRRLIIDANDPVPGDTKRYAEQMKIKNDELRVRISNVMGSIAKKMLDKGICATLLLTGGDTLLAAMKQINVKQIQPIREVAPGVVLSRLEYRGKDYYVISKSGGFGEYRLISDLANRYVLDTRMEGIL